MIFGKVIAYLQNQIEKKKVFRSLLLKTDCLCWLSEKLLCIYATNINKNCKFKKISYGKGMHFCDFW